MEDIIINKVAESALTTIDLETYYPSGEIDVFDLKEHLFMELILKEKDFRTALATYDWSKFNGKNVGITCSADAIIPMWAYMLVSSYLTPVARQVMFGDEQLVLQQLFVQSLQAVKGEEYNGKRVVIKGCGDKSVPEAAYVEITNRLRPFVKSIMYGEPCSTVPIYKLKP